MKKLLFSVFTLLFVSSFALNVFGLPFDTNKWDLGFEKQPLPTYKPLPSLKPMPTLVNLGEVGPIKTFKPPVLQILGPAVTPTISPIPTFDPTIKPTRKPTPVPTNTPTSSPDTENTPNTSPTIVPQPSSNIDASSTNENLPRAGETNPLVFVIFGLALIGGGFIFYIKSH